MEIKQGISQTQSQHLSLGQAQRQSIEILGLSSQELEQRIQKEILENPVLEETNGEAQDSLVSPDWGKELKREKNKADREAESLENKWEDSLGRLTPSTSQALEKTERKHEFIQNAVRARESLGEHLIWQLRMSSLNEQEQNIGRTIISAIDERGFLSCSLGELFPKGDQKVIKRVLERIQSFDPIACASRNIAEALLFQARHHKPKDKISQDILENYFPELEKLDFEKIGKEAAIPWEEIQKSLHFIQSLEPYPGRLYAQAAPEYIRPDIIVQERKGELYLSLADDWLPGLKIVDNYESMFKKVSSYSSYKNKGGRYLKDKFNAAQMLIQSIRRRRETLLQVSEKIVEHQKDFFLKGPQGLKPLILETIAQSMEIHNSTVSRAIANKHLQCQWGYFDLKHFFSAKLKSLSSGTTAIAAQNIKERLRLLIEKEELTSPLSDQELLSIFQKEGVQIARRTIAKYREILNIPSAQQRRKIAMLKSQPKKL